MQGFNSESRGRSLRSTLSAVLVALSVVGVGSFAAVGCGGGGGGGGGGGTFSSNVSGSKSTVSAATASTTAPADGKTGIPITVTIKDSNGNPIKNAVVTATASGTDTFISYSGITNSLGVVTVTVTSTVAQTETLTFTAFVNGVATGTPITQTVSVTFTAIPVGSIGSSITASPTSLTADGVSTSTISVTVLDANSAPVSNANVTFTAVGTSITLSPTTPVATSSSGTASATIASTVAQTGVTVSAAIAFPGSGTTTATTLTSAPITFVAGNAAGIAFVTSNLTATAGSPFTLQVAVVDANGNTVPGAGNQILLDIPSTTCSPFVQGSATLTGYHHPLLGAQSSFTQGNTLGLAQGGTATFPGMVIDTAGNYTVGATCTSLGSTTTTFKVQGNVATALAFKNGVLNNAAGDNTDHEPSSVISGNAFGSGKSPSVTVYAVDVFGNQASSLPAGVGAITVTPGTGSFTAGATQSFGSNATALSFPGLIQSALTANTTTTMTAADANGILSTSAASLAYSTVAATNPCQVVLTAANVSFASDVVASPGNITVTLQDSAGATASAVNGTVTVAIWAQDQCGNSTNLGSVTFATSASGTTSFAIPTATLTKVGTYTLFTSGATASAATASTDGNVPVLAYSGRGSSTTGTGTSGTLTVTPGAPKTFQFSMVPGNGYPFGTLTGTNGAGTPNATNIGFGSGQAITPAIQAEVEDTYGNICTNATTSAGNLTITLTLAPKSTGTATLGGGTTSTTAVANVTNGIASFGNLFIANSPGNNTVTPGTDQDPSGYSLTATSTGSTALTAAGLTNGALLLNAMGTTGSPNSANVGTTNAAKIVFVNHPANSIATGWLLTDGANGTSPNDYVLQIQDAYGTPVAPSTGITLQLVQYSAGSGSLQPNANPQSIVGSTAYGTTSQGSIGSGNAAGDSTTVSLTASGGVFNSVAVTDLKGQAHFNTINTMFQDYAGNGFRFVAAAPSSVTTPATLNWTASSAWDVSAAQARAVDIQQNLPVVTGNVQVIQGQVIAPCLVASGSFNPPGVTCTASGGVPILRIQDRRGNIVTNFSGVVDCSLVQPLPSGASTNATTIGFTAPSSSTIVGGYAVLNNLKMSGQLPTTANNSTITKGYKFVFDATNNAGSLGNSSNNPTLVESSLFNNAD